MMYDQNEQNDLFENHFEQQTQQTVENQSSYTYVFSEGTLMGKEDVGACGTSPKRNGFSITVAIFTVLLCGAVAFFAACGGTYLAQNLAQSTQESVVESPDADSLHHNDPQSLLAMGDSKPSIYGSAGDEVFSVSQVVSHVQDAVVVIDVVLQSSLISQGTSSGSGVIISNQGYILTCNHVVRGAKQITVTLNSGSKYAAAFVGGDEQSDLAVIKIEPQSDEPLTYVEHGKSEHLVAGETVVAIGNPLGMLGGTVTRGIISSTQRNVTMSDGTVMTLLQTDAAVNSGNSGGGLFNLDGQLIGIVNAKYESKEGLAFAIPIDFALPVEQDLIRYGYVRGIVDHGLKTLYISESELYIYRYQFDIQSSGVYVISSEICQELANKDKIISINGVAIATEEQMEQLIKQYQIGDTLTIVASRDGEEFTVTLTLKEYVPENVSNELK